MQFLYRDQWPKAVLRLGSFQFIASKNCLRLVPKVSSSNRVLEMGLELFRGAEKHVVFDSVIKGGEMTLVLPRAPEGFFVDPRSGCSPNFFLDLSKGIIERIYLCGCNSECVNQGLGLSISSVSTLPAW
jgi:hypothetical protein